MWKKTPSRLGFTTSCLLKKVSQTKDANRWQGFILRLHDLAFLHFRRFGQVGYLVTVQTWQRTKSWRASCHFAIFPSLVNFDFCFILSLNRALLMFSKMAIESSDPERSHPQPSASFGWYFGVAGNFRKIRHFCHFGLNLCQGFSLQCRHKFSVSQRTLLGGWPQSSWWPDQHSETFDFIRCCAPHVSFHFRGIEKFDTTHQKVAHG